MKEQSYICEHQSHSMVCLFCHAIRNGICKYCHQDTLKASFEERCKGRHEKCLERIIKIKKVKY